MSEIISKLNHTYPISCSLFFFISEIVDVPTPYSFANAFPLSPRTSLSTMSDFCFIVSVICFLLAGISILLKPTTEPIFDL